MAWRGDGFSRDITNEAIWRSSNDSILSVVGGLATGHQRGAVYLNATLDGLVGWPASQHVIVLPPETYVVSGQVIESRDPLATVDGAEVTVVGGIGSGQVVQTGPFTPGFHLYGLAGATVIRVSKAGYRTQEQTVMITGHQQLEIDLPLSEPRIDVSGSYTLTVTGANECGVGLGQGHVPEQARSRRYSAAVSQRGPELSIELSGATFSELMTQDSRITGRLEPSRISFDVSWGDAEWWFGPPRIAERLPDGETVVVSGSAEAVASGRQIVGSLSGSFSFYAAGVAPSANVAATANCWSPRHGFVLSR